MKLCITIRYHTIRYSDVGISTSSIITSSWGKHLKSWLFQTDGSWLLLMVTLWSPHSTAIYTVTKDGVLFWSWIIFHCVHVQLFLGHIYSFCFHEHWSADRWTHRLLPCLCYCEVCCDQHRSAWVSFIQSHHLLWFYTQEQNCLFSSWGCRFQGLGQWYPRLPQCPDDAYGYVMSQCSTNNC